MQISLTILSLGLDTITVTSNCAEVIWRY